MKRAMAETPTRPKVAVIIPAFNEQSFIGGTIECAQKHLDQVTFEIIVADNGSSDDTVAIASAGGAQVLIDRSKRIGGLRNLAVAQTTADILLFLDADVHLTPQWRQRLPHALGRLAQHPRTVTGSSYGIRSNGASWLERHWFEPMSRKPKRYINSGHLLMTRSFYLAIGGFDEGLQTGEDYELCRRAASRGGSIEPDPLLHVEHLGFPRTLRAFLAREAWHGLGDFQSLRAIRRSKVALAALLWSVLHVVLIIALMTTRPLLLLSVLIAIAALCIGTAIRIVKPTHPVQLLHATGVAYIYLFGRFLAGLRSVDPRQDKRRQRSLA